MDIGFNKDKKQPGHMHNIHYVQEGLVENTPVLANDFQPV